MDRYTPLMLVHFFVNGSASSAAGERASRIAARLSTIEAANEEIRCRLFTRTDSRRKAFLAMCEGALRERPDVVYCMDLAAAPVLAACITWPSTKVIIDTGDAPSDFLELVGASRQSRAAARAFERAGYWRASTIVVRGEHHRAMLRNAGVKGNICVIEDGVDRQMMQPNVSPELRAELGFERDNFVVAVQGNFTWYPNLGGGMGWDVVHAFAIAQQPNWRALLIGDGPGIAALDELAESLGVRSQIVHVDRVPVERLPQYLNVADVTILTQTNDASSWVRTTGKLPCYLACGKPVIASRVGTAASLLPESMLIDYDGHWDLAYPARLAERLMSWSASDRSGAVRDDMRELSARFDYDRIAQQAADVVLADASQLEMAA